MTTEEKAFDQLVEELWESLPEAARSLFREANSAAYMDHMIDNVCYQPWEYDEAMGNMRLAAAELTDHDCERLARIWRSALAAAASVDPYDYETLVAWRAYRGDLHRYYRMLSGMVEEVEREKRYAEFRKELAEREPMDDENIPF
jgi:hypothetical protein